MCINHSAIVPAYGSRAVAPKTPLMSALENLSILAAGRGACLCLEHAIHGVVVMADSAWSDETSRHGARMTSQAVFDLQNHNGFSRATVLVGTTNAHTDDDLMMDCDIAGAAIDLLNVLSADPVTSHQVSAPWQIAA